MAHSTLDKRGRVKPPRYVQKQMKKEGTRTKSNGLVDKLKDIKSIQIVLLVLFVICQIVYSFSVVWQSSGMLSVVKSNTEQFSNDWSLDELIEYNVYADGEVSFTTDYNLSFSKRKLEFVFIENNGTDKVYYSEDNNVIVAELPSNYWWSFLKGSKYLLVLFASILTCAFYFAVRKRGWSIFSTMFARATSVVGLIAVLFSGVLTWVSL